MAGPAVMVGGDVAAMAGPVGDDVVLLYLDGFVPAFGDGVAAQFDVVAAHASASGVEQLEVAPQGSESSDPFWIYGDHDSQHIDDA